MVARQVEWLNYDGAVSGSCWRQVSGTARAWGQTACTKCVECAWLLEEDHLPLDREVPDLQPEEVHAGAHGTARVVATAPNRSVVARGHWLVHESVHQAAPEISDRCASSPLSALSVFAVASAPRRCELGAEQERVQHDRAPRQCVGGLGGNLAQITLCSMGPLRSRTTGLRTT